MTHIKAPSFIKKVIENNNVSSYTSPSSGRITYNKIASPRNFAAFTDIITSIVPLDIVNDPAKNHKLPSIALTLKSTLAKNTQVKIYPQYLFLNATMEEYMDYEDEEDNENMEELLDEVAKLPDKTPLIGVAIQKSESMGSAHAIAFIAWRKNKKYMFAYYDPLAYKRGSKGYDYTDRAFQQSRFSNKLEFVNLNEYCFKSPTNPSDFHCSQYVINAEYCYIYSTFFLYKWIEQGHKIHRASFHKAITSTYIVHPSKLTRTDTKESMIYRVVMMQFICKTFLLYLKKLTKPQKKMIKDSEKNIERINIYLQDFEAKYGFPLKET